MQKISVIIPCFNGAGVINRSIGSVYAQHCSAGVELIVVDDGSTDSSQQEILNWLPLFKAKGWCLKYVYQTNRGQGSATNTGLKFVTGCYLTLLDADDAFLPGSLQKRFDFLEAHPSFVGVRTNGWLEKQGVRQLFETDPLTKFNPNLFDGLIGGNATNWAGSYLIRTGALFRFYSTRQIYPSRFGQNLQLLLPLAYQGMFGYIDEPLMVYYLQENSHSQAAACQEQHRKTDRNFYGYQDIYSQLLRQVVQDPVEHHHYQGIVTSWQYRHELKKALHDKDLSKAKQAYRQYLATGRMSLNEKIDYYTQVSRPIGLLLRVYRRLLSAVKMGKQK